MYDEAEVCVSIGKGNPEKIKAQCQRYREEGFPSHFGLLEANVVAVDLNNAVALDILECWWLELLRSGSGRDQLALPYVLWRLGLSVSDVGCLGPNSFRNPKLRFVEHNATTQEAHT